jgi:hypothetical protein
LRLLGHAVEQCGLPDPALIDLCWIGFGFGFGGFFLPANSQPFQSASVSGLLTPIFRRYIPFRVSNIDEIFWALTKSQGV